MGVGLAGLDLTGVYTDCAIATTNCVASTYNPFDGYALVSYVFDQNSVSNSYGACFPDSTCFTIDASSTNYAYNTLAISGAASASNPNSMTSDAVSANKCVANTGGFDT